VTIQVQNEGPASRDISPDVEVQGDRIRNRKRENQRPALKPRETEFLTGPPPQGDADEHDDQRQEIPGLDALPDLIA
jgi:hypothetical protein